MKRYRGEGRGGSRLALIALVSLLLIACGAPSIADNPLAPVDTPLATQTVTPSPPVTPTPSPTSTLASSETFVPPHPIAGVGDVREALVEGRVFQLEVARTREERAQGLMGRSSLPEDAAMLFVYDAEDALVFWMKDTLIPLDVLFLDSDGIVVNVQTMRPQPDATDATLTRYYAAAPARYAVEINAGLASEYDITAGSRVLFR